MSCVLAGAPSTTVRHAGHPPEGQGAERLGQPGPRGAGSGLTAGNGTDPKPMDQLAGNPWGPRATWLRKGGGLRRARPWTAGASHSRGEARLRGLLPSEAEQEHRQNRAWGPGRETWCTVSMGWGFPSRTREQDGERTVGDERRPRLAVTATGDMPPGALGGGSERALNKHWQKAPEHLHALVSWGGGVAVLGCGCGCSCGCDCARLWLQPHGMKCSHESNKAQGRVGGGEGGADPVVLAPFDPVSPLLAARTHTATPRADLEPGVISRGANL